MKLAFKICILFISMVFLGCKKDDCTVSSSSSGSYTSTVVLKNAFDAHIEFSASSTVNANSNTGNVPELPVFSGTVSGAQVYGRFLMKFPLDTLLSGSQILSAKLYLFGYPENYPSFAIPQGNAGDNVLLVQRVTESWDESTVTWNNQPATTSTDQVELPASTSTWNYNILEADITTLINQCFINNNFGLLFKLKTEQNYRSIGFLSNEYAVSSMRPMLLVTYRH
jgi:hypothetical protein